jgi:3-deoxy-D-manno-octulosonic-acid transferase
MVKGRKESFIILKEKIKPEDRVIWFHCASLGEFEQGRVLLEMFRKQEQDAKIVLTFFSPSGYEIRKNYPYADCIIYLPNDTKRNAEHFIQLANPQLTFFIKYEFWYNYLYFLSGRKVFQVSLILRKDHYLQKFYSGYFRKQLKVFNHFFVQNRETADILLKFGYTNASIVGDTRFDRVMQIAEQTTYIPLISQWCKDEKVLILGSSWEADEQLLYASKLASELKVIIVPHNISEGHIEYIKTLFADSVLFTQLNETNLNTNLIIVNTVGLLSSLYRYCQWAYIGGGFGEGIHNTLEAACFGKPVCFGTNYKKFKEAVDLVQLEGAKVITSPDDLRTFVNDLSVETKYEKVSFTCQNYVKDNAGASKRIMNYLKQEVL